MSAGKPTHTDLGPDLLARYLRVYMESRQMTDLERPWGLGDDSLNEVWIRLVAAQAGDPERVNHIIEHDLRDTARRRMIETLAPLFFALPIRVFPAELRAVRSGNRLAFVLSHDGAKQQIGFLPAALEPALKEFLRHTLHFHNGERRHEAVISSGGRRRRVSIWIPGEESPGSRGVAIRFLERLHSPAEEH